MICASYALGLYLPSLWTTRPDIYHPAAGVVAPLIRTVHGEPIGITTWPRHYLLKEGGRGGVVANSRVLLLGMLR